MKTISADFLSIVMMRELSIPEPVLRDTIKIIHDNTVGKSHPSLTSLRKSCAFSFAHETARAGSPKCLMIDQKLLKILAEVEPALRPGLELFDEKEDVKFWVSREILPEVTYSDTMHELTGSLDNVNAIMDAWLKQEYTRSYSIPAYMMTGRCNREILGHEGVKTRHVQMNLILENMIRYAPQYIHKIMELDGELMGIDAYTPYSSLCDKHSASDSLGCMDTSSFIRSKYEFPNQNNPWHVAAYESSITGEARFNFAEALIWANFGACCNHKPRNKYYSSEPWSPIPDIPTPLRVRVSSNIRRIPDFKKMISGEYSFEYCKQTKDFFTTLEVCPNPLPELEGGGDFVNAYYVQPTFIHSELIRLGMHKEAICAAWL